MSAPSPRRPLLAAVLSLLVPGLGQLYAGSLVPALVVLGAASAVGPLAALGARAAPAHALGWVVVGAAAWAGLLVASAVAAWRTASRAGALPSGSAAALHLAVLPAVDRWYVYAVLALLVVPSAATWAITVQAELVSVFFVPSGSMRPTLPTGARILVDRGAYRARPLCRGDVIVFPNPDQPHQIHVKRVLALPGDRVELRGDGVLVNGVRSPPPSGDGGGAVVDPNPGADVSGTVTVPHGHCFVMGDDRERSIGSREYGPVPIASVFGRVALVLFPRWQSVSGGACAGE